jgi:hypothetical protein
MQTVINGIMKLAAISSTPDLLKGIGLGLMAALILKRIKRIVRAL